MARAANKTPTTQRHGKKKLERPEGAYIFSDGSLLKSGNAGGGAFIVGSRGVEVAEVQNNFKDGGGGTRDWECCNGVGW